MSASKRVVILEQLGVAPLMFRYMLWADVPTSRQPFYAAAQNSLISAWKDASASDLALLQSGAVTERVDQMTMSRGDNAAVALQRLQKIWSDFQAEINAANPWVRYGTFLDATGSWSAGGVV